MIGNAEFGERAFLIPMKIDGPGLDVVAVVQA
jgi:hypothetical protein